MGARRRATGFGEGAEGLAFLVDFLGAVLEAFLDAFGEVARPVFHGVGLAVDLNFVEDFQKDGFVALRLEGDALFIEPSVRPEDNAGAEEMEVLSP